MTKRITLRQYSAELYRLTYSLIIYVLATESDRSSLQIAVIDRGLGIPKHLQRKVFKPFYRVAENSQASVKGFGLGLSYVQRIVEAHAWHLELASEVGKGSEFKIRCPKSTPACTNAVATL
ncbi:MAG TPA: ATP-binding protein [Fibrella sp.]